MRAGGYLLLAAAVVVFVLCVPAGDSEASSEMRLSDGTSYAYETFGSAYPGYHSELYSVSTDEEGLYVSSALEGYELWEIHDGAFSGIPSRYVVVPASVSKIGSGVFDGCRDLESVYFMGDRPDMPDDAVPEGVRILYMPGASGWTDGEGILTATIDSDDGSSMLYAVIEGVAMAVSGTPSPGGSIHIASTVDGHPVGSVGPSAFAGIHDEGRTDVRTLDIADGVGIIRERAFFYCYGLESVSIPDSVTVIMDEAFRADTALKDAVIPDSVIYLGFESFRDCSSLPSISIPDSVAFMGEGAFKLCRSAESISVGSGLRGIPVMAFAYADAAASVEFHGDTEVLGDSAFYMCPSLRSAVLPDSVVSLGRGCFYGCASLGSIGLGDSLRTIGQECFQGCSSLGTVVVPASVETVGGKAFAYCSSLEDVYFKGDMPELGSGAFLNDDVRVHCTAEHRDSWSSFDGVVVDGGSEDETRSYVWIAAIATIVLAVVVSILLHRRYA